MRIGIFGVTGNPIHNGHYEVMREALREVGEVWVTLVYNHAFGKSFESYEDRLEMLRLFMMDKEDNRIKIKELDKEYYEKYGGTVYSYNLLKYLKEKYEGNDYKLVIGEDNYKKEVWSKFYKNDDIDKEFGVVVVKDRGSHSTDIRNKLKNGENVVELVGESVERYIQKKKLYKF